MARGVSYLPLWHAEYRGTMARGVSCITNVRLARGTGSVEEVKWLCCIVLLTL